MSVQGPTARWLQSFFIIFINAKQDFINKKPMCGTEEKISPKMKNKTKQNPQPSSTYTKGTTNCNQNNTSRHGHTTAIQFEKKTY